jgi:hypothetical protein
LHPFDQLRHRLSRLPVDILNAPAGIVDPIKQGSVAVNEAEQPLHGSGGIKRGEIDANRLEGGGQILGERAFLFPGDHRPPPLQRSETAIDQGGNGGRPLGPGQGCLDPLTKSRVALRLLQDQPAEHVRPHISEEREVLPTMGFRPARNSEIGRPWQRRRDGVKCERRQGLPSPNTLSSVPMCYLRGAGDAKKRR